ncbi:MAG: FecR domain-containing protein [Planctomycetota bacterium]|jgi:DNA-directed RNA polymerase subunit M/transcription elongation factor TFIIS
MDNSINKQMTCQQALHLVDAYILNDPSLMIEDRKSIESHLQNCPKCAQEYEKAGLIMNLVKKYWSEKSGNHLVVESTEQPTERRMTAKEGWKDLCRRCPDLAENTEKPRSSQLFVRISAVAACLVIGILTWMVFLNHSKPQTLPQDSSSQQVASVSKPSVKVELLTNTGNIPIPSDQQITSSGQLKTLLINGKHRLMMNTDTILTVKVLEENSNIGCLVKLASGRIYTHVEHDGNPFAVDTACGRAVITGTTFDIEATEDSTTLVVTEGTVQFKSENNAVEVTAGQTSKIIDQSAPSNPISCNAAELTAWATGYKPNNAVAQIKSATDSYNAAGLALFTIRDTLNLESIDYEEWIEKRRDWFMQEFPWIFQLKNTLAREGIKVDYPELLSQSSDIWQFVFPESTSQRIPALKTESLVKVSSHYGYNDEWLFKAVPATKFLSVENVATKDQFFGLEAFEQWQKCFEEARWHLVEVDSDTLRYSFHASVYIARTRVLAWLCTQKGLFEDKSQDNAELLSLLQMQIKAAGNNLQTTIQLMTTTQKSCSTEYLHCVGAMLENIEGLQQSQKKIYDNLQIVVKGGGL